MAYDNKTILRDAANQPIPQVYDDQTDAYQPATGTDGKQHVIPHNPDGSPADFRGLSTEATLAALSAKIDTLQAAVEAQAKGTDADPATTVLSGSNASDLEPVVALAEPTFAPYAYPFLTTDGVLEVVTANGQTRTYPAGTFPLGVILPLRVKQVLSGTTASLLAATPST